MIYVVVGRNRLSKNTLVYNAYKNETYAKTQRHNLRMRGRTIGQDSVAIRECPDDTSYVVFESEKNSDYRNILEFCKTKDGAESVRDLADSIHDTYISSLDISNEKPESSAEYRLQYNDMAIGYNFADDEKGPTKWTTDLDDIFSVMENIIDAADWVGSNVFTIEAKNKDSSRGPKVKAKCGRHFSRPEHPDDLDWKSH